MTLTSGLRLGPARGGTAAAFGVLALATSMTLTAPAQAASGDKTAVRTLAVRVGATIGAASSCQSIARVRIQALIEKFSAVVEQAAANEVERVSIVQQMDRSVADGRRA